MANFPFETSGFSNLLVGAFHGWDLSGGMKNGKMFTHKFFGRIYVNFCKGEVYILQMTIQITQGNPFNPNRVKIQYSY